MKIFFAALVYYSDLSQVTDLRCYFPPCRGLIFFRGLYLIGGKFQSPHTYPQKPRKPLICGVIVPLPTFREAKALHDVLTGRAWVIVTSRQTLVLTRQTPGVYFLQPSLSNYPEH